MSLFRPRKGEDEDRDGITFGGLLLLRQKASSLMLSSQRDLRLRQIALGDTAF